MTTNSYNPLESKLYESTSHKKLIKGGNLQQALWKEQAKNTAEGQAARELLKLEGEVESKVLHEFLEDLRIIVTKNLPSDWTIQLLNGVKKRLTNYEKLQKEADKFLGEHLEFEVRVDNIINETLTTPPEDERGRWIYLGCAFAIKVALKKELYRNLRKAIKNGEDENDLEKRANALTKNWLEGFKKTGGDNEKISLRELVYADEVEHLIRDQRFLLIMGRRLQEGAKSKKDKMGFVRDYLKSWAMVPDANGVNFAKEARAMMLRSIGEGDLTQKDFLKLWNELKKDKSVSNVWKESGEEGLQFEELLKGNEKEITKEYVTQRLIDFAARMVLNDKPAWGSSTYLAREARMLLLETVGNGKISKADFDSIWRKITGKDGKNEEDKNVKLVWEEKEDGAKSRKKFEALLEKTDKKIRKVYKKDLRVSAAYRREAAFNPYGLGMRQWGDLFSAILYAAEKILYGVLLANFALAGFSPIKLIQNPILWATAGAIYLTGKHYGGFKPTPETHKNAKQGLEEKVLGLKNKKVKNWLSVFSLKDIKEFFSANPQAKGSRKVTSMEMENFLIHNRKTSGESRKEKIKNLDLTFSLSENDIIEDNSESSQIFELFMSCQYNKVNPKDVISNE